MSSESHSKRVVRKFCLCPCFAAKKTSTIVTVFVKQATSSFRLSRKEIRVEAGSPTGPSNVIIVENEVITENRPITYVKEGIQMMRKSLADAGENDLKSILSDTPFDEDMGYDSDDGSNVSFQDLNFFTSFRSQKSNRVLKRQFSNKEETAI